MMRVSFACVLGVALSAACEQPAANPTPPAATRPAPETTMIPVAPLPRMVARDSVPENIYFDLTRFEWYAHGEPLRWEDRDWHPVGAPVELPIEELRKVGDYEGVDVWAPEAAEVFTVLYVPVSEGFWLRFMPAPGSLP